jgi:hypothetical protein
MKLAWLALFGALTTHALGAQQAGTVNEARAVDPTVSIRIFNLYGSIRVIGWDVDSLHVTGPLSLGERFFVGGGRQGMKLGVESAEERTVRGAHLVVHVPRRARVWVKTASAEIDVSGVTGGLDLYSVGARIRVSGDPRELNAEAMDGDIEIAGSPAWLRAKTASGAITVKGTADDAGLSTVSGAIAVTGGRITRGRFESVTGDVRFDGDFDRGGSFTFDTHSGAVTLALPPTVAADFDLTSIAGVVANALSPAQPVAGRGMRGNELHFATDPGGARVTVRTFKGTITLRRR